MKNNGHNLYDYSCVVDGTGVSNQGFMLARQQLYCLSHSFSTF
jgi:hypothetical protein